MDSAKAQLAERLKTASNVLVTVSRDPSVDQLAACIGLTLLLNKMGKHAAAVFSGAVPSTIEFLKPEETIEKNTDSLRDFIIALDKSKADKLRYKVEDNVVRIFITPYKTSISQNDLEFSQGDFNVDVVVALGVQEQADLDEAITTHGRILHDATVASLNVRAQNGVGSIIWNDAQASSLSELVTELAQAMGPNLIDNQISTALLTGIVAETDRFSNEKTSSQTMSASAALMANGANQQLVASELQAPAEPPAPAVDSSTSTDEILPSSDGTLEIEHQPGQDTNSDDSNESPASITHDEPLFDGPNDAMLPLELPEPEPQASNNPFALDQQPDAAAESTGRLITGTPSLGGTLTANSTPEALDPATDPLSPNKPQYDSILDHSEEQVVPEEVKLPEVDPFAPPTPSAPDQSTPRALTPQTPPAPDNFTPPPAAWTPPANDAFVVHPDAPAPAVPPAAPLVDAQDETLSQLEALVNSPHLAPANLDSARDQVNQALNASAAPAPAPEPIQALNAQPLGEELHAPLTITPPAEPQPAGFVTPDNKTAVTVVSPSIPTIPVPNAPAAPQVTDPTAPPPVPPPLPFQFGGPGTSPQ